MHADPIQNERSLIAAAASGDADAFGRLAIRYTPRVYCLVRRRCPGAADAEDLTQETFLQAWRSIANYQHRDGSTFASWLFSIAVRHAAAAHRRFKPALTLNGDHAQTATPARDAAPAGDVWDLADRILDLDSRTALWLCYAEDLTPAQVATVLGKPQSTVRVLLFRARKLLAAALGPCRDASVREPQPAPLPSKGGCVHALAR